METFTRRIIIILLVITFPIWILPCALVAIFLIFLENVFNLHW